MRELLEQGYEIAVVKDATAAAIVPDGNGYEAALVNFASWRTRYGPPRKPPRPSPSNNQYPGETARGVWHGFGQSAQPQHAPDAEYGPSASTRKA